MLAILPRPVENLDSQIVRSFRSLALRGIVKPGAKPGHPDGWGMVVWRGGIPEYIGREPLNAFTDPKYEVACMQIENEGISSPLMAHLRKASVGAKTRENTHPFVSREWAFAHNGTIRGLNLRNSTDSEWFFRLLIARFDNKNGVLDSIIDEVSAVKEVYNYTSLTFILSNGRELYAYKDCSSSEDYYTMYYAKTPKGLVVSQERFFESDWKEIENGELLIASPNSSVEIIDLAQTTHAVNRAKA